MGNLGRCWNLSATHVRVCPETGETNMNPEVDCVILWHTFLLGGQFFNSNSTHLVGSMENLNDRLREANEEAVQDQLAGRPYTVAAQIITNRN